MWCIFTMVWDWPIRGSLMWGSVWQVRFSSRAVGEWIWKSPGDRPCWHSFEMCVGYDRCLSRAGELLRASDLFRMWIP